MATQQIAPRTSPASSPTTSAISDDGTTLTSTHPSPIPSTDDIWDDTTARDSGSTEGATDVVSAMPRLRAQHSKAGYRDAVAATKEAHLQTGFDAGYPVGAGLGVRVGRILGVLDGLLVGMKGEDEAGRERVRGLRARAGRELVVGKLVGREEVLGLDEGEEERGPHEELEEERGEADGHGKLSGDAEELLRRWEGVLDKEGRKVGLGFGSGG